MMPLRCRWRLRTTAPAWAVIVWPAVWSREDPAEELHYGEENERATPAAISAAIPG
jgi:hypothetical protein